MSTVPINGFCFISATIPSQSRKTPYTGTLTCNWREKSVKTAMPAHLIGRSYPMLF